MTDRSNYTSDLPAGWCTATLGDVTQINAPLPQAELEDETEVSFLAMRSVEEETGRFDTSVTRPVGSVKRGYTSFVDGDVIFAKITPCMENGKFAVVRNLKNGIGFGSTEFHVLRPEGGILNQFLFFYLVQKSFRHEAQSKMTGSAGQKRVPTSFVEAAGIPIPPTNEQQRIVAKIEELFTQLDSGVEELFKAQTQLKRYRQAVLKAAVTGEMTREWRKAHKDELEPASELLARILKERRSAWDATQLTRKGPSPKKDGGKPEYQEPAAPVIHNLPKLPKSWTWASISQVGEVTGGLTKNPRREKLPAKIPYLRVANVYAGELDLTEVKSIGIDQSELERVLLTAGDLLVVEGNGSIDQIGRVALWDGKIAPCAHQNHLIKVRFNQPKLGKYILWWLLSSEGRNFITKIASSTSGLHTLSISKVASLPVPLPSILEQEQIVREIERVLSIADVMQQALDIASRQAERLRQSILKQAFEGRLVAQDTNDEPAERLLERIKIERAKREAEKQAEATSNRKRFTKSTKRTERPAA